MNQFSWPLNYEALTFVLKQETDYPGRSSESRCRYARGTAFAVATREVASDGKMNASSATSAAANRLTPPAPPTALPTLPKTAGLSGGSGGSSGDFGAGVEPVLVAAAAAFASVGETTVT